MVPLMRGVTRKQDEMVAGDAVALLAVIALTL
jgi:hypothetical protein